MSSDDPVIRVRDLSKCYHLYAQPRDRLKQMIYPRAQRMLGRPCKQYFSEFWALRDISLEVRRGETVGIIGRNGAGKSTLLQLICGTTAPTAGSVEVQGRVAALLELGTGFNPEFTGRENVYLNGSVLGLSDREIDARYEEILDFADIGEFIDHPVRTYSSGMYMRLAFAVATCVDPDILVVDEALAVGDIQFQAKCFRKFEELVAGGMTLLLVTHSTDQIVRHCSRSILLESGAILENGESRAVANAYYDLLFGAAATGHGEAAEAAPPSEPHDAPDSPPMLTGRFEDRETYNPEEYRWGNREAEIVDCLVTRDGHRGETTLRGPEPFHVLLAVVFHVDVARPIYGLAFKTPDGVTVYGSNSRDYINGPLYQSAKKGERHHIRFSVGQGLAAGDFLISVGVAEDRDGEIVPLDRRFDSIHLHVESGDTSYGLADFHMDVAVFTPDQSGIREEDARTPTTSGEANRG